MSFDLTGPQTSIMKMLRADTGAQDLSRDPKETIAAGDKRYSASTMRNVLSTLRRVYPDNQFFIDEMAKRKEVFVEIDTAQTATPRQVEQFIKWDDVLALRDDKFDVMTPEERVLLGLYTYIPPVRLDWTPMELVSRKPRNPEEGMNYLVFGVGSVSALFNAYKTVKQYGEKYFKLPAKLGRLIRDYLALNTLDRKYLFQDEAGRPWSPSRLGASVQRIFQKYKNMDTGVSMLRHSYATQFHEGQKPMKELKGVASKMMHSPTMSQTYRFLNLE